MFQKYVVLLGAISCTLPAGCSDGSATIAMLQLGDEVPLDAGVDAATLDAAARPSPMNVGLLPGASIPPLGEGVAPMGGTGGDGATSVPGKGPAEGGPGAIRWYGGQWQIPYSGRPGSVVQNVSCDVIPNGQSTDLIELLGPGGVIGSVTVPAITGVTIRAWITVTHAIADGEVLVLRHSPRDVATGGWTTGVEQLTIVGCAVNAVNTLPLAGAAFIAALNALNVEKHSAPS